jgi:cytochrome c553
MPQSPDDTSATTSRATGAARLVVIAALAMVWPGAQRAAAQSVPAKVQLCASCHGQAGAPSDPTVPVLFGQQADYIAKQLHDYVNGDRDSQIMASIAESLSDDDIRQIAAYYAGQRWPTSAATALPPPDAIATCGACHQDNFSGGASPAGVAPRLAAQSAPYLLGAINAFGSGDRRNNEPMTDIAKVLSADDRKRVADYLAAFRSRAAITTTG